MTDFSFTCKYKWTNWYDLFIISLFIYNVHDIQLCIYSNNIHNIQ